MLLRKYSRALSLVVVVAGCTQREVDLSDRACAEGACTSGYACNPLSGFCTPRVDADPASITTGSDCTAIGAYIPCAGASCEGSGCRLCADDATWSTCKCLPDDSACMCAIANTCGGCVTQNGGIELCNTVDDDCNGRIDDAPENAEGCTTFYRDADGDSYGNSTQTVCYCAQPPGYVGNGDDPNDTDPAIFPNGPELCNGIDDNGDTVIPANELDSDGDGYVSCTGWVGGGGKQSGDCDDMNANKHPGAPEILNSADDDCDGTIDECVADCNCGSLVACYTLDQSPPVYSGPGAVTGVLFGGASPVNSAGKVNACYALSKTTVTRVGAHNDADLSTAGDFTMMAWIFPSAATLDGNVNTRSYLADVQNTYILELRGDGSLRCQTHAHNTYTAAGTVTGGNWRHVACSYAQSTDASHGNVRILVNGDVVRNEAITDAATPVSTGAFCIGANSNGDDCTSSYYDGKIDHLQIFNQKLRNDQICGAAGRSGCVSN